MTGTNSCTNGASDNGKEIRIEDEVLVKLLAVINEAGLSPAQVGDIIPEFLFSIGTHLEGCGSLQSSEDVLKRYATKPTLGSALMAQALWMRDNWKKAIQGEEDE